VCVWDIPAPIELVLHQHYLARKVFATERWSSTWPTPTAGGSADLRATVARWQRRPDRALAPARLPQHGRARPPVPPSHRPTAATSSPASPDPPSPTSAAGPSPPTRARAWASSPRCACRRAPPRGLSRSCPGSSITRSSASRSSCSSLRGGRPNPMSPESSSLFLG